MSYSNLTELFTATAEAIRGKTGGTEPIVANAFPAAIEGIPAGGGGGDNFKALVEGTATFLSDSNVQKIRGSAFYGFNELTGVNFPECSSIEPMAFRYCRNLASANFPKVKAIGASAFAEATQLSNIDFPVCESLWKGAFYKCSYLTSVSLPACRTIDSEGIRYCGELKTISLPAVTLINSAAFDRCFNLVSFYLMGSSLCTLSRSDAFGSTPIAGYSASAGQFGSIFVPASLLTAYQSATNWAYYSSRFVGVE